MMNVDMLANEILNDVGKTKTVNTQQTQYHRAGKGRKYCEKCKTYVGVRTKVCVCGHEFVFNVPKTEVQQQEEANEITDEDRRYAVAIGAQGGTFVFTGSGSPLGRVYGVCAENKVSVINFCEDIVAFGLKESRVYLPSAIKNFLRHSADNCETMFDIVDDWYNEKVASTMNLDIPESE